MPNRGLEAGGEVPRELGPVKEKKKKLLKEHKWIGVDAQIKEGILSQVIGDIQMKKMEKTRWLKLLIGELAEVKTEVERELIIGLIKDNRAFLDPMDRIIVKLQKLKNGVEPKEAQILLTDEERDYLKSVTLKRGRRPKALLVDAESFLENDTIENDTIESDVGNGVLPPLSDIADLPEDTTMSRKKKKLGKQNDGSVGFC